MIHRIKQATTSSSETIYPVKKYDLTNTITRINDQVHTKMCLDVANTLILDDIVPHFLTIELFSTSQRAAVTFIAFTLKLFI